MKVFVDANLLIYLNTVTEPSERLLYDDYYVKLVMENTGPTPIPWSSTSCCSS